VPRAGIAFSYDKRFKLGKGTNKKPNKNRRMAVFAAVA